MLGGAVVRGVRLRALLAAIVGAIAALTWAEPVAAQERPDPPKCEFFSCQDPLFTVEYPPRETFVTSRGVEVDLPTHFYQGDAMNLYGVASRRAVEKFTAGSGFHPVLTDSGKGIVYVNCNEWEDTNIEPYLECLTLVPVSEERKTVPYSSGNPYEVMAGTIDPDTKLFVGKLILDQQLPIDVGRESYHMDKDPLPFRMTVDPRPSGVDVEATAPDGSPVLSVHMPIDVSPQGQATEWELLSRTEGFRKSFQDITSNGGLIRFNYMFRDIVTPSQLVRTHSLGRLSSDPAFLGGSRDRVTSDAAFEFEVHSGTAFGTQLERLRFRPRIVETLVDNRFVLDRGWRD